MKRNALLRLLFLMLALMGSLACSLSLPDGPAPDVAPEALDGTPETAPQVALAAPLEGAAYLEGVSVNILARVTNAGEDIDRVEVLVDDTIVTTLPAAAVNPAGVMAFSVAQSWPAAGNGPHTIGLTVFRTDGSSSAPISRTIEVVDPNAPVLVEGGGASEDALVEAADTPGPVVEDADGPPETEDVPDETATPSPSPEPSNTPAPTATSTPSVPMAIFSQGANIRTGPSTEFDVIGGFQAGTETEALAVTSSGDWYKIKYYNGEGWVFNTLVSVSNSGRLPIDDGPELPTDTPVPPTATPVPDPQKNLAFNGNPEIDPFPPKCGQTMEITVKIVNNDDEALGTGSVVQVLDKHVSSGLVTQTTAPLPNLDPGETAEVSGIFLTVDTNFGSEHVIEIRLDSNSQITESDENDNLYASARYTLEDSDAC